MSKPYKEGMTIIYELKKKKDKPQNIYEFISFASQRSYLPNKKNIKITVQYA